MGRREGKEEVIAGGRVSLGRWEVVEAGALVPDPEGSRSDHQC